MFWTPSWQIWLDAEQVIDQIAAGFYLAWEVW